MKQQNNMKQENVNQDTKCHARHFFAFSRKTGVVFEILAVFRNTSKYFEIKMLPMLQLYIRPYLT